VSSTPFVSVVVPCFNEARRIGRTLSALLEQSYPKQRYEIVVVDNGSTDDTRRIVAGFPVCCLTETRRSSYAARNTGIAATSGDYVAFIDSDCVAEPGWLESLVRCDRESGHGLVAGRIELSPPARPTRGGRLLALRFSSGVRRANAEARGAAPGGNLLVRREVFEEIGVFDVSVSGGDSEFSQAAARSGRKLVYAADAVVWHPGDISDAEFLRRSFRIHYGKGARRRSHPGALQEIVRRLPWRPQWTLPAELCAADPMAGSRQRRLGWLAFLWLDALACWAGAACGALGIPYRGDRR
jgi:glycosyltransferase involved in cell wall biosynthesis